MGPQRRTGTELLAREAEVSKSAREPYAFRMLPARGGPWGLVVSGALSTAGCFFDLPPLSEATGAGGGGGETTPASATSTSSASTGTGTSGGAGPGGAGGGAGGAPGGLADDYAATVMVDAPIAYWRLDDAPGSATAADAVGAFDATVAGDVELGVEGVLAGSRGARLTGGSLLVGDAFDFPAAAPFTFEAWVSIPALPSSFARVWDKTVTNGNGRNGMTFFVRDPGNGGLGFALERWVNGSLDCHTHVGDAFPVDEFKHLVVTFDGASLVMYLDGTALRTNVCTAPLADHVAPFRWGATSDASNGLEGTVDELAVYDQALSPSRVTAHFQAGRPPAMNRRP